MEVNQNVEHQVSEIDKKVTTMLQLLQGNPYNKEDKGMVGDVSELSERVDKLEKFKDRAFYLAIFLALPSSYGSISILSDLIKAVSQIFHK